MQSNQTMEKAVAVFGELRTRANTTKDKAKGKAVIVYNDLKARTMETKDKAVVLSVDTKDKAVVLLRDPEVQMCTVATAGGAITFSAAGGAFGMASGIVAGSAAGVFPALLTLGLSIPAGAAVGGIGGLCTGTLIGGASGGMAGFTVYKYRIEIENGVMTVKVKTQHMIHSTKLRAVVAWSDASQAARARVYKVQVAVGAIASKAKNNSVVAMELAKTKASEAYNFATTTKVGVTSSSAAAGAVVGGTTGGALGTVAGAAVGIVPAVFTFGLSIPAGAMIGLCAGSAVGGSVGAVSGGAIGYTGFAHGKAISESVKSSLVKASTKAENLKIKTLTCAAEATKSVKTMVRGSTGGSAHDKDD